MKTVCSLLGLSADADETSVHAAVSKLQNRVTTLEGEATPLQNRKTELEAEKQTLLGEQCEAILDGCGIKPDDKRRAHLVGSLAVLKNRAERLAHLADFGIKPVEAGKAGSPRVLNRGSGAAAAQSDAISDDAALEKEKLRAQKIMNRAAVINKETPTISLGTAVVMATKEIAE